MRWSSFKISGVSLPCTPWGGGSSKRIGPPLGNQNRLTPGFYVRSEFPQDGSIDAVIQDLCRRALDELSIEVGVDLCLLFTYQGGDDSWHLLTPLR